MIANPIEDSEYAARTQAVRTALSARGLDVLLAYGAHRDYHPADLRYLARWYCVEEETSCVVIALDGPTTLVPDASWDVERAEAEAYADRVRLAPDMGSTLADLVREAAGEEARVGIAGFGIFPARSTSPSPASCPGPTSPTPPISPLSCAW